jgi:8-oxo-dGTP diphosphatase
MSDPLIFGEPVPGAEYVERPAAYAVIENEQCVAVVMPKEACFLPGGGSLPAESPEDTVVREVREELGRHVRLTGRIGEAVQYFYSADDDVYYKLPATFFTAEFIGKATATGETVLLWLPREEAIKACFHACHAWAIRRSAA